MKTGAPFHPSQCHYIRIYPTPQYAAVNFSYVYYRRSPRKNAEAPVSVNLFRLFFSYGSQTQLPLR